MKQGMKRKLIRVEAQSLKIHPVAQRDLVPSNLKRISENLDLDAIGVLHAVEYHINGVFGTWLIDGHHRVQALIDRGLGEWFVDVCVHTDVKDDARAAALFLKLDTFASVHPFDKYKNRLTAKDPAALGVQALAKAYDLTVDRSAGDGRLTCVTTLLGSFSQDNGESLSKAFDTIISAWGRGASGLEGKLVAGLSLIYQTYNGSVDMPVMVKKLSKYPGGASAVIGDGKGAMRLLKTSLPRCIAQVVIEAYNSGRRTGKLDPL